MVWRYVLHILCTFFPVFFVACEGYQFLDDRIPASTNRTVLVYLGVDNNFWPEAAEKIEQLTENWDKNIDGNLLVYADAGERPVLVHIYHTEKRGNVADTIEIYPRENSASPQTFARVLREVKAYCPASSYGLVVLSHATGWLPAEMSKPSPKLRSVIVDMGANETANYMELSDFADAIPYNLEFIVFDACFMASVETCYELKDKAKYIVASPTEVLTPGFVYASMMKHLFKPEADLKAVAREFYEYYDKQSDLYRSATISVVKTAGLDELATITKEISGQNTSWVNINSVQSYGYGKQKIYSDLGDYVRQMSPERYDVFQRALDGCVQYKAHTPFFYSSGTETLHIIRTFSGLSVYMPQAAYVEANEAYKKLKWAERIR